MNPWIAKQLDREVFRVGDRVTEHEAERAGFGVKVSHVLGICGGLGLMVVFMMATGQNEGSGPPRDARGQYVPYKNR